MKINLIRKITVCPEKKDVNVGLGKGYVWIRCTAASVKRSEETWKIYTVV